MTYKELTEKMSKENLSQMEGSDEMLRSAEGADMELSIDDIGFIAGGAGLGKKAEDRCAKCHGPIEFIYFEDALVNVPFYYRVFKCLKCGNVMREDETVNIVVPDGE